MDFDSMYERDLLYPTSNIFEPGSVHVNILNPARNGKIPVIVEGKTHHSPIEHIDTVVRIMQADIFDRIHIDIMENVSLYLKVNGDDADYLQVVFDAGKTEFVSVHKIEL